MKLSCIIDTNSCIHLSNVSFSQKTLLEYFKSKTYLAFSKEVHLELKDHSDKNLPRFILDTKRKIIPKRFTISEYETRMIGRALPSRKKKQDKGEVDNFLISVDQVHYFKKSNIVYITDDQKAVNGILDVWLKAFPAINLWNSFDVVLYLYAEKVIPSKDIAIDLIQDILKFSAPRAAERNAKTTEKLTRTKVDYTNRLHQISKLIH